MRNYYWFIGFCTVIFIFLSVLLAGCNNPTGGGSNAPGGSSGLSIEWAKCYGGSGYEGANDVLQTIDGGYVVVGFSTSSNEGDVVGINRGIYDYWTIKLNLSGSIEWQNYIGGSDQDVARSVYQTLDGNYVIAGVTLSNNGDVSGNHNSGYSDVWLVKLNSNGTVESKKCFGGTNSEGVFKITKTTDGKYIYAGYTGSNDGDVNGIHSSGSFYYDCWVVKLDSTGTNIEWQKCYGGTLEEHASDILQTSDGGYVFAGTARSNDGDVSGNNGGLDLWVVKLNSLGTLEWQKCFGGSGDEYSSGIQQTSDGGYIVCADTPSNDKDVNGNHGGIADAWIIKLTSQGTLEWQKCLGGSGYDSLRDIIQISDGGYICVGETDSNDGDISGNHGNGDGWLVKLNSSGTNIEWQMCIGGSSDESISKIKKTTDGGYVLVGRTNSNDGDVSGNHGGYRDLWVVKMK